MTYLKLLVILPFLFSCSNDTKEVNRFGKKHSGLYIENGPRQGSRYFDSAGTEFNYRYITSTIINDTTIPIQINIDLPIVYDYPCTNDSTKFHVFILSRELTPKQQQFDSFLSKQVKNFLDSIALAPVILNKTINPKEKCIVTFGTLTKAGYIDPAEIALITKDHDFYFNRNDSAINKLSSTYDPLSLTLGMSFLTFPDTDTTDCYLVIPCGKISFQKN